MQFVRPGRNPIGDECDRAVDSAARSVRPGLLDAPVPLRVTVAARTFGAVTKTATIIPYSSRGASAASTSSISWFSWSESSILRIWGFVAIRCQSLAVSTFTESLGCVASSSASQILRTIGVR